MITVTGIQVLDGMIEGLIYVPKCFGDIFGVYLPNGAYDLGFWIGLCVFFMILFRLLFRRTFEWGSDDHR